METKIVIEDVQKDVAAIKSSFYLTKDAEPIHIGVILSIHIQSNRPDNFIKFLDNLQETADDYTAFEVVVKIDDYDMVMNQLLPQEIKKRPFKVRYISTPLKGGFFGLWESMNDLLRACDPDAYFLVNFNDEMYFKRKGWDTILKQYVGLFPDHIFRLRTSLFRYRNYYDHWECGFAPETSAITTKRWIEIGGNWNPCLGPDTFQQCVAYYFGYHHRFEKNRLLREVPLNNFNIGGEGATIGLEGEARYKWFRGATKSWCRLMSYEMQLEASRRARKLHAYILGKELEIKNFSIVDKKNKKEIHLINQDTNEIIRKLNYELGKFKIKFGNFIRYFQYLYYAGGGVVIKESSANHLWSFLILRYDTFLSLRDFIIYVMFFGIRILRKIKRSLNAIFHASN